LARSIDLALVPACFSAAAVEGIAPSARRRRKDPSHLLLSPGFMEINSPHLWGAGGCLGASLRQPLPPADRGRLHARCTITASLRDFLPLRAFSIPPALSPDRAGFCSPPPAHPREVYSTRRHLASSWRFRWVVLTFVLNACSSGPVGKNGEEREKLPQAPVRSEADISLPRLNGWNDLKPSSRRPARKSKSFGEKSSTPSRRWTGFLPQLPWPCQGRRHAKQGKPARSESIASASLRWNH